MAADTIFTTEVPDGHNFFENGPVTLSSTFYTIEDTLVDAAQWWAASNKPAGGTYELVLFKSTVEDGVGPAGVQVATIPVDIADVPLDTWTGWKTFTAPVQIEGYHAYKIGLRTSLGSYTATNNFFTAPYTHGKLVVPQSLVLEAGVGSFYNGSYATDLTSYPDHTFNASAYFVDVRTVDFSLTTGPQLVRQVHAATHANNSTPVSVTITPANGDIVVIKSQTWDYSLSMSITNNGGLTFTRQENGNGSGFYPWVGIDTAEVSGTPGKITIEMTPSGACWHGMTVEVWRNAQIGPHILAIANASPMSATLTGTAPSQISWVAGDSQSRDPALGAYISGSVEEFLDDGHVGSNSVTYYGLHPVAASGSVTFGVTNPSPFSGKIAGIEIQEAPSGTVSQQFDLRWSVAQQVAQQYDLRWAAYQLVSQQFELDWSVAQRINAQYDLQWQVAQTIARQFDLRWSVAALVANQFDLRWTVIGRVKAQFSLKWSVDAFGPALPTKPIVVNRHTNALVINRTTGVDFRAERG